MEASAIITIDGPAGSGKSTVAAALAQKLGITYLDTGALYRAVTLAAIQRKVPLDDPAALTDLAENLVMRVSGGSADLRVFADGCEVTEQIRSAEVTGQAQHLARVAGVRMRV